MQKHRFNVRLGSVISGGERKKLGWTAREERGRRLDAEEAEAHPEALGRMSVILLMEHSGWAFEGIESTEGSPRSRATETVSSGTRLHSGRHPH